MPMRYAVEADVLALTDIETSVDAASEYAQIVRLENALCDVFDEKIERSFGSSPTAELRAIRTERGTPLTLSTALRSVTSISIDGTWNGTGWDNAVTLTTNQYRLTGQTSQGYFSIDRMDGGGWGDVVRITGVWADQVTASVPGDVAQALTEITVKEWHRRHMSPAGAIGPEGLAILPGNPWNLEYVKTVISKYQLVQVFV